MHYRYMFLFALLSITHQYVIDETIGAIPEIPQGSSLEDETGLKETPAETENKRIFNDDYITFTDKFKAFDRDYLAKSIVAKKYAGDFVESFLENWKKMLDDPAKKAKFLSLLCFASQKFVTSRASSQPILEEKALKIAKNLVEIASLLKNLKSVSSSSITPPKDEEFDEYFQSCFKHENPWLGPESIKEWFESYSAMAGEHFEKEAMWKEFGKKLLNTGLKKFSIFKEIDYKWFDYFSNDIRSKTYKDIIYQLFNDALLWPSADWRLKNQEQLPFLYWRYFFLLRITSQSFFGTYFEDNQSKLDMIDFEFKHYYDENGVKNYFPQYEPFHSEFIEAFSTFLLSSNKFFRKCKDERKSMENFADGFNKLGVGLPLNTGAFALKIKNKCDFMDNRYKWPTEKTTINSEEYAKIYMNHIKEEMIVKSDNYNYNTLNAKILFKLFYPTPDSRFTRPDKNVIKIILYYTAFKLYQERNQFARHVDTKFVTEAKILGKTNVEEDEEDSEEEDEDDIITWQERDEQVRLQRQLELENMMKHERETEHSSEEGPELPSDEEPKLPSNEEPIPSSDEEPIPRPDGKPEPLPDGKPELSSEKTPELPPDGKPEIPPDETPKPPDSPPGSKPEPPPDETPKPPPDETPKPPPGKKPKLPSGRKPKLPPGKKPDLPPDKEPKPPPDKEPKPPSDDIGNRIVKTPSISPPVNETQVPVITQPSAPIDSETQKPASLPPLEPTSPPKRLSVAWFKKHKLVAMTIPAIIIPVVLYIFNFQAVNDYISGLSSSSWNLLGSAKPIVAPQLEKTSSKTTYIVAIVINILLVVIIGLGYYFWKKKSALDDPNIMKDKDMIGEGSQVEDTDDNEANGKDKASNIRCDQNLSENGLSTLLKSNFGSKIQSDLQTKPLFKSTFMTSELDKKALFKSTFMKSNLQINPVFKSALMKSDPQRKVLFKSTLMKSNLQNNTIFKSNLMKSGLQKAPFKSALMTPDAQKTPFKSTLMKSVVPATPDTKT